MLQKNTVKNNELSQKRRNRLRKTPCLLGQPELVSIKRIREVKSFLNHKREVEISEFFISGVNLITTAHLSSFVNDLLIDVEKKQKNVEYHIRVFMFDAFQKIDVEVEVSIPGSLQIKAYNLEGHSELADDETYQRAFFSSVLRNLYLSNFHPCMLLRHEIKQFSVLKNFLQNFIPFSLKNYIDHESTEQTYYGKYNIGLESVIHYFLEKKYYNLLRVIDACLAKFELRRFFFRLQVKQCHSFYKDILYETAQAYKNKKFDRRTMRKVKEFQMKSLLKLERYTEAKQLMELLIKQGMKNEDVWHEIIYAQDQMIDDEVEMLKIINIGCNFCEKNDFKKIEKQLYPRGMRQMSKIGFIRKKGYISEEPGLCFLFDTDFMKNNTMFSQIKELFSTKKLNKSLEILQQLQNHVKELHPFEKRVVLFEKTYGWSNLLDLRGRAFWIDKDFNPEESVMFRANYYEEVYTFTEEEQEPKSKIKPTFYFIQEDSMEDHYTVEDEQDQKKSANDVQQEPSIASVDADFSVASIENDKQKIVDVPPCSKRIPISNKFSMNGSHICNRKVLCNLVLEDIFNDICNSLKVQALAQRWSVHFNLNKVATYSKEKRFLLAFIFYQKALLHKKLRRFKKCEQTLQLIPKMSPNLLINLVSIYQLGQLYLENKVVKGVEKCLISIVKILYQIGIKHYDVIPLWVQKMLLYLIDEYGDSVWKSAKGPLFQILSLWAEISGSSIPKQESKIEIKPIADDPPQKHKK